MRTKSIPRYLRIAHWIADTSQWVSRQEVAEAFDVSCRFVSSVFALFRQRSDLFEIKEQVTRQKGKPIYKIMVVCVRPYILDERQHPHVWQDIRTFPRAVFTWRDLLSRPWSQLAAMSTQAMMQNIESEAQPDFGILYKNMVERNGLGTSFN